MSIFSSQFQSLKNSFNEVTSNVLSKVTNNKKKVFGVPLDRNSTSIPNVVKQCITYLDQNGIELEGIFRLSGNQNLINELKDKFDKGEEIDFFNYNNNNLNNSKIDPHTVAGLLKLYFRLLPEPLMTFEMYDIFIATIAIKDISVQIKQLKKILECIPKSNLIVTSYLISFLKRVCEKSEKNKMTPTNVSIVFAPNLLRSENDDLNIALHDAPYANKLLTFFIEHFDELFKDIILPSEESCEKSELMESQKENKEAEKKDLVSKLKKTTIDAYSNVKNYFKKDSSNENNETELDSKINHSNNNKLTLRSKLFSSERTNNNKEEKNYPSVSVSSLQQSFEKQSSKSNSNSSSTTSNQLPKPKKIVIPENFTKADQNYSKKKSTF